MVGGLLEPDVGVTVALAEQGRAFAADASKRREILAHVEADASADGPLSVAVNSSFRAPSHAHLPAAAGLQRNVRVLLLAARPSGGHCERPLWQKGGGLPAKRFALMMKKVIEKGDSFIVAETARLHSLLDDPSVAPAQVRRNNHRPMRRDAPLAMQWSSPLLNGKRCRRESCEVRVYSCSWTSSACAPMRFPLSRVIPLLRLPVAKVNSRSSTKTSGCADGIETGPTPARY